MVCGKQSISSLIVIITPSKTDIGCPTKTHIQHDQYISEYVTTNGSLSLQSYLPSSNLRVEASACFLTSLASKLIKNGVGDLSYLNSSMIEIIFSATYKSSTRFLDMYQNKYNNFFFF